MKHTMQNNSFVSVIEGFNAAEATDCDLNDLKELVYQQKVVVLKQQLLDRPAYLEFAARFGALEQFRLKNYHDPQYPNILVINNRNRGKSVGARMLGNMWHSDSSYLPDPLPLTFLHAQHVPAGTGDTLFVDMQAALGELPADLLEFVTGRQAEHDVRWTYKVKDSDLGESIGEIFARVGKSFPAVHHPTIIAHPITGNAALYLNPGYTVRICGFTEDVSRDILSRIFSHVIRPQTVFAYRWEPHDLLIWDNRSVIHCATQVPEDADRLMYRIGVTDGPFFGT